MNVIHSPALIVQDIHLSVSGFSYNRECHRQSSWWKMMENEAVSAAYSRWHWSPLTMTVYRWWWPLPSRILPDHCLYPHCCKTIQNVIKKGQHLELLQKDQLLYVCEIMFYILYFSSTFKISYVIQFPFIFFWVHLTPLSPKSLHFKILT